MILRVYPFTFSDSREMMLAMKERARPTPHYLLHTLVLFALVAVLAYARKQLPPQFPQPRPVTYDGPDGHLAVQMSHKP